MFNGGLGLLVVIIMLSYIPPDSPIESFPSLDEALQEPNGLLAVGGDLSVNRLIYAYQQGIFPWYNDDLILWWSPNPRLVLFPDKLKISRSLKKNQRNAGFSVTFDQAFKQVVQACAHTPRPDQNGTWINHDMQAAYDDLYQCGIAHSVECWHEQKLVGGLYGIALGRVFFGESMFSHRSNASKVAFVTLVQQLQAWQFALIDCQVHTQHLESFGAEEIPRRDFSQLLKQYDASDHNDSHWQG